MRTTLQQAPAQIEPVHPLHVDVGHDDVEVLRLQETESVAWRGPRGDDEAACREACFEHAAHVLIVVDDENTNAHALFTGMNTENVLPFSTSLATAIQPAWSFTMP